ncbi:TolC family protein [Vicingus serpentipes]|uniref:TolC family protein n=1 Tax=Vicingus serpentipes TaxID=1926625 RepID=A0A5C6RNX1_9FLAO|nr:TolC family protein [Vicingus serpentipes]TXB63927.1 TolC family protein [Vicingus serpentipes]
MIKTITTIYLSTLVALALAQETQSFSLAQAQSYALENNYDKLNAESDLLIAKKKVWETTGIGLPQVNFEAKLQNFIDLPTSLIPANAFDPNAPAGEFAELRFGTNYNNSATISANQLLFDGSYLVGLKAARVYKEFSEKNISKTEIQVKEDVAQAYYLVLVAEENKRILEEVATTTEKLLSETTKIYEEGFAEEQNVDQLRLTLNDINNSLAYAEQQLSIAKNLLKFQLGYEIKNEINLTDNIESLLKLSDPENSISKEFDITNNVDYQMIKVNEELMKLNFNKEKFSFAPSVAAFFSHSQQNMSNDFDAFSGGKYYPQTLWGISLQLPIISGGMRLAKTGQAKVEYLKAQTTSKKVEQSLILQAERSKAEYTSALSVYNNQKEGVTLAKKINNHSIIKYNEGIISSLELSQSQNQYLDTEAKYIKSLLDVFNAKSNLNKAIGTN